MENTTSGRQFFKVPGVGFYSSLKSSAAVVFVYKPGQIPLAKSAPGRFQNQQFFEKHDHGFLKNRVAVFSKTGAHFLNFRRKESRQRAGGGCRSISRAAKIYARGAARKKCPNQHNLDYMGPLPQICRPKKSAETGIILIHERFFAFSFVFVAVGIRRKFFQKTVIFQGKIAPPSKSTAAAKRRRKFLKRCPGLLKMISRFP